MGWADCGDDEHGRPIGYGFSGSCDTPGCQEVVSRGLGSLCGEMHLDGETCHGYFCDEHLFMAEVGMGWRCIDCLEGNVPDRTYCRICGSSEDLTKRALCRDCEWSLNHEGFDWDLLDTIETQADKFKMTMRIPCYRRCFRIGRSVTLDEAGRCSECGQTWKGPPERPDRYQELSRDHA